jgi:large subunit ribosomal protein L19|tara:strand:- start:52 stop:426 length:375 start_codon:yes stop_codon:yes gene_type:complete
MANTLFSQDLIKLIENKFLENQNTEKKDTVNVGDIIKVEYRIPDGEKERIQTYEGLVIAKQNRSLGKSFTLRRNVDGVGVEQIFLLYSPKIASITRKQASKVRRAKLYFIRKLRGKATRLKIKR